jgi:hypothetical protein
MLYRVEEVLESNGLIWNITIITSTSTTISTTITIVIAL